jgi:LacI family transcriptional regulator
MSPGSENGKDFSVATNDLDVSAAMTEYLASLGHKRIAFITGNPSHKAVANRFKGYRAGLRKSGLAFSEQFVVAGDNSIGSGEKCAQTLLSRKPRPTAIFAANDDMAAGVIRVANRMGISVPDELSVAGYDDISLAQQIYPSLTTIRQPLAEMAECAANAIIAAGKDGLPAGTEVIPASIQLRESTGPAPQK